MLKNFIKKTLKSFVLLALICAFIIPLSACGAKNNDITNYLIEERDNLFSANDSVYTATFSTGKRENNYNLDGVINEMVDFGVLTLFRNDNTTLANDKYTYLVKINDESYTGFLSQSLNENSYSADLQIRANDDDKISVEISFTGYTFKQDLENTSAKFNVDKSAALKIANKELMPELKNITSNGSDIEVIMKIVKDYSSELKNYYWYVGVVSTKGDALGILIDANSGEIIAKKV